MLNVNGLSCSYGAVQIVRGVSLDVPAGEVTCVIGRNGVGKTTLLKAIMGVLKPSAGSVSLEGAELVHLPANRRARAGVALVPQGRMIFPKLTIEENLKVGLQARADGRRTIPPEVYDTFPVLKQMNKRMGGDLSGGQQQQLAIARALVGEPKVLLLDEPTEGIQPNVIQQIGAVLTQLVRQRRMAVVLVEQYLDFVKEFGQRFHIMNRGRVAAQGATNELSDALVNQHLGV